MTRLPRTWLAVLALALAVPQAWAADSAPTGPVVRLKNGGYASGTPIDKADPGTLRVQSPAFAAPLEFALGAVETVSWPAPAALPKATGEFRFELAGGDVVYGSLLALDESAVEIEVSRLGRVRVDRANVHRITRWGDRTDVVYNGPNGFTGWHEPKPPGAWREESGQPFTDVEGAVLRGDFGLPARAAIELELSWKKRPDFIFALGVDDDDVNLRQAFRFEVWENDLVIHREVGESADVALVRSLGKEGGRFHILAYLDQEKGTLLAVAPDGKPLGQIAVPGNPARRALPGVALVNVRGDLRLERLVISRWDGSAPREVLADRSRIHRADGTIAYGQVVRYDPGAREFVLRGDEGESRVAASQIAQVFLSMPAKAVPRDLRVAYLDGSRLSGLLRKIEGKTVELDIPGFRETVRLPLTDVQALVVLRPDAPAAPRGEGRSGTLELDGVHLSGVLNDAKATADAGPLAWRADGAVKATPLRPAVSGRILYQIPKPSVAGTNAPPQAMRAGVAGAIVIAANRLIAERPQPGRSPSQTPVRRALHLRSGDIIPCEVLAIDEDGVSFKSQMAPKSRVAHARVKAVELEPLATDGIKLSKAKRERMLTLPRMQKDSPPTQLVRSTNGDYLRGRITAMDEKNLNIEVRLEAKTVPRDRIARIIWFHADELDPSKRVAGPDGGDKGTRVQAVRGDGIRLTFRAEEVAGGTVRGTSDILGECKVKLDEVDQLLIGPAIESEAAKLVYGRWVLHNAEEPKFAKGDASGGSAGTESPMVGKPAPDFELDLLDGKRFQLSKSKGQVVILDFWATWCGPCLQAMPQVERVAREFRDKGVRLVAVNLQEAPKDISAMLERHKLDLTVALDRDGVVADRYNATAIPQTVVIDRDGTVSRLFVGGGPDFEDQLREALGKLPGMTPEEPKK